MEENNLLESVHSFNHWVSREETWVIRLVSKRLHPLGHLIRLRILLTCVIMHSPKSQNLPFQFKMGQYIKHQVQLGTAAHTYNLSTREAEAGGWHVTDQLVY